MKDQRDDVLSDAPTFAVPRLRPQAFATARYSLVVAEGPDSGRRWTVDASQPCRLLLGKGPACDLRLADPTVSRRHAAVEVVGQRLRLDDLGSTNGTFVDGIAILGAYLRGGEVVRLGGTALRVEEDKTAIALPVTGATSFGRMLGASPAMRRLYPLCERLAASDVTVILEGETGTGKEQLAEALHECSARSKGPYVVFDCTAVAPSLIEAELFGYERGAFTGAVAARKGVFERADGGTLLLDEIGDLPLELQPKLLRAIEREEIQRLGGQRPIHVNTRVVAATRRDLDKEVQLGRFRDDLYHRIAIARIELPPLRDRVGDVSLLARHFAQQLGGSAEALPADLLLRWETWSWPGNVRELRNAVARWIALGDLDESQPDSSSGSAPAATQPRNAQGDSIARVLALDLPLAEARDRIVEEFERRYLERVLDLHGGDTARAAAAAGVARRHLQRLKSRIG